MRLPGMRFTLRRMMAVVAAIALVSGGEVARRHWSFCMRKVSEHGRLDATYTLSATWRSVCPSPMVTIWSSGAKGSNSRNLQTPEEFNGLSRSDHLAWKSDIRLGTGSRFQS